MAVKPPPHIILPRFSRRIVPASLLFIGFLVLGLGIASYMRKQRPASSGIVYSIPALLTQINSSLHPEANQFLNSARAAALKAKLHNAQQPANEYDRLAMQWSYARELVNSGKSEEALQTFEAIEKEVKTKAPEYLEPMKYKLRLNEAICCLRTGEQQNCCALNNSRSCLAPITGKGIHTKPAGSLQAIDFLQDILSDHPDDLSARWLLNIAYMTVGRYPDKVPPKFLIPKKTYGGEYPMAKFVNAAPQLGLDVVGNAGSVIMEDFEGNGLLDLVISSFRIDGQLRYFHNNGDGTFKERTTQAGITGEVGGLNMITTDFNNDGRPDIIVLRGG